MRTHVINRLIEKAREDDRIVLLVGDLGFHVVEGFQNEFPNRFVNCGISEQNMMAVAAGMAKEGDKVFVYSIGNFPTLRCLEQIRNDVCYHDADVNIIAVGGGFSYGSLGMTHHTTEELAILRALPNMNVYAPADHFEATAVLDRMVKDSSPSYIRLARGADSTFYNKPFHGDIHKIILFEENECERFYDITIISSGPILEEAIKTKQPLEQKGFKVRLYSCPSIKPLDIESIEEIARTSQFIVSVEEHNIIGGLGGAIAEVLSGMEKHACLIRFGLKDTYSSEVGCREYLRSYYGIDAEHIVNVLLERMKKR